VSRHRHLIRIAVGASIAFSGWSDAAHADFAAGAADYAVGDYRAAVNEWTKAAWDADHRAQAALASLLERGLGGDQDTEAAYVWYQIADLDPDIDLTAKLAALAQHLTPAQLNEAEQEADARSIVILSRQVAPPREPTAPVRAPDGYTWMCDCGRADPGEDASSLGPDLGSKFTF
jgi:TPR repeat protein